MRFNEYPAAIAKLQKQILSLEEEIQAYQTYLKEAEAEIDRVVAFDSTLKNDAQRKAKRQELLDSKQIYQEWKESLQAVSAKREEVFIELCLRRNEFSVLKLEKRQAIAQMELQASA